jgi:Domain of unknown function (DU1801)
MKSQAKRYRFDEKSNAMATTKKSHPANNKTQPTHDDVAGFLATVVDPVRRADCEHLVVLMQAATGEPPRMWGSSIVGFGTYHYRYESGREGDYLIVGFSPRKGDLSLYILAGFEHHAKLLAQLGPHKIGKSCLYVKGLAGLDEPSLKSLIEQGVAAMAPQRIH